MPRRIEVQGDLRARAPSVHEVISRVNWSHSPSGAKRKNADQLYENHSKHPHSSCGTKPRHPQPANAQKKEADPAAARRAVGQGVEQWIHLSRRIPAVAQRLPAPPRRRVQAKLRGLAAAPTPPPRRRSALARGCNPLWIRFGHGPRTGVLCGGSAALRRARRPLAVARRRGGRIRPAATKSHAIQISQLRGGASLQRPAAAPRWAAGRGSALAPRPGRSRRGVDGPAP